ncbi:hypothetical protein RSOLAG22IIIB_08655 [Rhizoctonia solani]|uniref:Uncharacterized protein n=1 Tax=Rhizoctonia solani TaxID=456999 RepID=A0A0K6FUK0_9AGAM|nr:hypothetical protein RSOLAG22IIIB_08655 [Rhizoctonia solani]
MSAIVWPSVSRVFPFRSTHHTLLSLANPLSPPSPHCWPNGLNRGTPIRGGLRPIGFSGLLQRRIHHAPPYLPMMMREWRIIRKYSTIERLKPISRMEPVPLIKNHCKAKELSTEQLLSSVESWYNEGALGQLCLRGMDFEDFEDLYRELDQLGVELRFDWNNESRTAIIRARTTLSEMIGRWFGYQFVNLINRKLAQVAICGNPSVANMDRWELPIAIGPPKGDEQSSVLPDQYICLVQSDADGNRIHIPSIGSPRVVFETWESEYGYHMINKAFKYLYGTDSVNVVIFCIMTNIPLLKSCKTEPVPDKPFKAEISVWSRKANDLGHHLDPCDHKVGDSLDSVSQPDHADASASSLVPSEFNDRAREYFRPDPNNPGQEQRIYRRSPWVVLCDESAPIEHGEPQQELMLDVYDFLCPCSQCPDRDIRERNIAIPLKELGDLIKSGVGYKRGF